MGRPAIEQGMRRALIASALLLILGLALGPPALGTHVDLGELVPIAPWDALDTITDPTFNDSLYVGPYEEVVGISIGNESHAYPLKLMNWHEVIDDVVGGVPVVVSYCPLCGTAITYERTVAGRVLTFRTSGLLYRNNKVMFDVETGSLWPQILGEAINGTYHGTRLRFVTTTRTTFSDWLALHPDAKVVARPWGEVLCPSPCRVPLGFEGYDVNPYARYQAGDETLAGVRFPDPRLHPKTFVVGIALAGEAWAVAYPDLLERRAVNAVVGGVPIAAALAVDPAQPLAPASPHVYAREGRTFRADPATNELVDERGQRFDIRTGAGPNGTLMPVPFAYGFWFAWHDLHPDTRLFGLDAPGAVDAPHLLGAGALGSGMIALAAAVLWRLRRSPL